MENLQKSLISFFVSFISSHNSDSFLTEQLIKKMLKLKSVQKIIIKTMCKLEPIINEEMLILKSPKSQKSSNPLMRKSKLLLLSQDVKNLMNNYENIQGKISSMLNIVDSIDFHVDHTPSIQEHKIDPPRELVVFLSSILRKKRITNQEIEEISEEV